MIHSPARARAVNASGLILAAFTTCLDGATGWRVATLRAGCQ